MPTHFNFFGASLQTPQSTLLFTGHDTEAQGGDGEARVGGKLKWMEPEPSRREGADESALG